MVTPTRYTPGGVRLPIGAPAVIELPQPVPRIEVAHLGSESATASTEVALETRVGGCVTEPNEVRAFVTGRAAAGQASVRFGLAGGREIAFSVEDLARLHQALVARDPDGVTRELARALLASRVIPTGAAEEVTMPSDDEPPAGEGADAEGAIADTGTA